MVHLAPFYVEHHWSVCDGLTAMFNITRKRRADVWPNVMQAGCYDDQNSQKTATMKSVVLIQKFQGHYWFHILGFSTSWCKAWTICGVYCMWDEEPTCCGRLTTGRLHTETGSGASWSKCQTCPLAYSMKGTELTMKGSIGHRCRLHAGTTASSANSAVIMHEQTCPRMGLWRTSVLSVFECRSLWATSSFNAAEQKEAVQTPRAQLEAFDQYFRLLLPEIQSPRR